MKSSSTALEGRTPVGEMTGNSPSLSSPEETGDTAPDQTRGAVCHKATTVPNLDYTHKPIEELKRDADHWRERLDRIEKDQPISVSRQEALRYVENWTEVYSKYVLAYGKYLIAYCSSNHTQDLDASNVTLMRQDQLASCGQTPESDK